MTQGKNNLRKLTTVQGPIPKKPLTPTMKNTT